MIRETNAAIALKIKDLFGARFKVYTEDIKQELKGPCFRITTLKPSSSQMPIARKKKIRPYVINFFPEDDNSRDEMDAMGETLEDALSLISLADGSWIRGTNISYEIENGILHIFVNYDYDTITRSEEPTIEEITIEKGKIL